MSEGRRKGKVKFFNRNKGFGYITASDGYDCFVHFSNIEGGRTSKTGHVYLATEEEVEFDPQYEERKDKWVANKVTCLAASDNPSIGKKGKVQKGKGSSEGKGNSKIEHEIIEEELHSAEKPVRSLTEHLIDAGVYSTYTAWRDAHEKWLDGRPKHSISVGAVYPLQPQAETRSWRDYYRAWREGKAQGAQGETGTAVARPLTRVRTGSTSLASSSNLAALSNEERPAVVFDVVVPDDEEAFRNVPAVVYKAGDPALVPVDGPPVPPILIRSFPPEALVTIRTFRFFEDRSDEKQVWEQELQNVNSGSLVFLPVHMCPGYHSLSGAKFGKWFTIHYIQVYAKHFSSSYFRADEGSCFPAKTFGATSATTSTVSGKELEKGYFWYVSPATEQATLENEGWQHLHRDGPFDGESFLEEWRRSRCPMEARALQEVLDSVICNDDAA